MTDKFQHSPLEGADAIRLLRLEPGLPLHGKIEHHSLSQAPPYRALSYTWKLYQQPLHHHIPPERGFSVLLNGQSYQLLENLFLFLETLCVQAFDPEILWCDYICINQSNVHERNHQVSLMGRIYTTATEVKVWLGSDSYRPRLDLDYLSRAGPAARDFSTNEARRS